MIKIIVNPAQVSDHHPQPVDRGDTIHKTIESHSLNVDVVNFNRIPSIPSEKGWHFAKGTFFTLNSHPKQASMHPQLASTTVSLATSALA